MTAATLEPDLQAAATFLDALAPDGKLTFQTFDDSKEKHRELNRVLHGTLAKHTRELTRLNQAGAGVFVMVNRGDLKGRSAKNVTHIRALFLDLDGAPLQTVQDSNPPPHLITQTSSGRFHAYWRIKALATGQFKAIQKALLHAYGGDPKVHDLPRVMRLPGFYHRKGEPFRVRVTAQADNPAHDVNELLQRLGIDAPAAPVDYQHGKGTLPTKGFAKLDHVHLEHDNYKRLSPLARALLVELVKQYNGFNNGDLCLAPATLRARGLNLAKRTIWRARDELLTCGWITYTRTRPRQCYLLALTFKPIDACNGKHDAEPTSIASDSWRHPPAVSWRIQNTTVVHSEHQRRQKARKSEAA